MYFALSLLCLLANLTIIFSIFKSSKKSFNLKIRFNFQEVKNSSFAVSLISVFQFVAMTAYVASSLIVIYYRRDIPHEYFHNIILCIYVSLKLQLHLTCPPFSDNSLWRIMSTTQRDLLYQVDFWSSKDTNRPDDEYEQNWDDGWKDVPAQKCVGFFGSIDSDEEILMFFLFFRAPCFSENIKQNGFIT